MYHSRLPYTIKSLFIVNKANIKFFMLFGVLMKEFCKMNKLSVVLAFGLNPNCSGLRMLWISIYLFNLDCKIDVNNLPKQLVKVI